MPANSWAGRPDGTVPQKRKLPRRAFRCGGRKAETVRQERTSASATARLGKPHLEQTQIGTRHGRPPCVRVARLRRLATGVRDKWSSNDRTRLIGPLAHLDMLCRERPRLPAAPLPTKPPHSRDKRRQERENKKASPLHRAARPSTNAGSSADSQPGKCPSRSPRNQRLRRPRQNPRSPSRPWKAWGWQERPPCPWAEESRNSPSPHA